MNPPMIGFDVDGVLFNFVRGFTRIGHKLFGTTVGDMPSHQSWMFEECPPLGLTKEHVTACWDVVKASKYFWATLDPCNVSVMHTIDRIKNKVFITNRLGDLAHSQTVDSLERWGVIDPAVHIAREKGPVAKDLNVVGYLDDFYPNCRDVATACPAAYVSLLAVPYSLPHLTVPDHFGGPDWTGPVAMSVDHFIADCDKRGLIEWTDKAESTGVGRIESQLMSDMKAENLITL